MKHRPDRLPVPLLAAVLLSAAAHAAVVIAANERAPLSIVARLATADGSAPVLQARLRPPLPVLATPATASPVTSAAASADLRYDAPRPAKASPMSSLASIGRTAHAASQPSKTVASADAMPPAHAQTEALTDALTDETADERPTPLTYPVISLPSDDDPHRIGLVRLLLVVSSEGHVVRTSVTAATLSQEYVERIAHSFEDVRFKPASAHGFPRAGWYEVVVNLDFDPEARNAL